MSLYLDVFVTEWSPMLLLPDIDSDWDIILPVGESTSTFRNFALPSILQNLVNLFEGIDSSWLNSQVSLEVD